MTTSSTGGEIVKFDGGLIHRENGARFIDEWENNTGINGRPSKESVEWGIKFDLSAFPQPAVPEWTGVSRVVTFK